MTPSPRARVIELIRENEQHRSPDLAPVDMPDLPSECSAFPMMKDGTDPIGLHSTRLSADAVDQHGIAGLRNHNGELSHPSVAVLHPFAAGGDAQLGPPPPGSPATGRDYA